MRMPSTCTRTCTPDASHTIDVHPRCTRVHKMPCKTPCPQRTHTHNSDLHWADTHTHTLCIRKTPRTGSTHTQDASHWVDTYAECGSTCMQDMGRRICRTPHAGSTHMQDTSHWVDACVHTLDMHHIYCGSPVDIT
jgi:hypothetical protein